MRVSSYRKKDGSFSYGVVTDAGISDVSDAFKAEYPDLKSVLQAGGLDKLRSQAESFSKISLEDVELLPPIPWPDKIICIGFNYRAHIKETGRDTPSHPPVFTRYPNSVVGHGVPIIRPAVSEMFDYEGELAFIVGKGGRNVSKDKAMEHVAGFACANEGSVRDYQRHTTQFWAGKNFERSGSVGPWMITPDEVDVTAQTLETRLNGTVVQSTGISDLLFDIPTLIEYLSIVTELHPGDVVMTGTPGGVGSFHKPPLWMKPGDTLEVEITGIGKLSNVVAEETQRG